MVYKTLQVSEECHRKVKLIASLEGMEIREWMEWAVDMAYQSAMHNRGRKSLPVVG